MTHAPAFGVGLVATAYGYGFRHGFDWDHVAALADLSSVARSRRRSMTLATVYVLGHALVVAILGSLAVLFARRLPPGIDTLMERVVGATLLLLATSVLYGLLRHGRRFRLRSRWMLLGDGLRRLQTWRRPLPVVVVVEHAESPAAALPRPEPPAHATSDPRSTHSHWHRHVGVLPGDPFGNYRSRTAFAIGMLHGLGAETSTQVLIFLTAADISDPAHGLVLLGSFVVGLLSSNALLAVATAFSLGGSRRVDAVYIAFSLGTAGFSLVLGTVFLLGRGDALPTMLVG